MQWNMEFSILRQVNAFFAGCQMTLESDSRLDLVGEEEELYEQPPDSDAACV